MDLNSIKLPTSTLTGLYRNVLTSANEKKPIADSAKKYTVLGDNEKKTILVIDAPGHAFMPDKHLALVTKLLEACKMNIADVAVVNHASRSVNIADLKAELQCRILILFGTPPTAIQLPISFPQFKTQDYDGCTYLYAPSLNELDQPGEEGKLLKSKLWVCLRKLFEV